MQPLIVAITNDPITSNPREAELTTMTFDKQFHIEIVMAVAEKDSVSGERLFDIAQSKQALTDLQRKDAMSKHFPQNSRPYTTKGSKVNAQGEVRDDGTIDELDFLTSITFAEFKTMLGKTDTDSVLLAIREFIGLKMQEISARGQN
jgi:hypothetical protein